MTQQTIQALPGGDNTPVERIPCRASATSNWAGRLAIRCSNQDQLMSVRIFGPSRGYLLRGSAIAAALSLGQKGNWTGQKASFDALVEPAPVASESLDHVHHARRQDVKSFELFVNDEKMMDASIPEML
jgi:hypothetical protein